VQITGQWLGSVSMIFSSSSIRRAAQAMLLVDASQVSEADERDVGAELVNMIGGNFKSLLPAPVQLSLPSTCTGHQLQPEVHGAALIDSMVFQFEEEYVQVSVYESQTLGG
jgi:chemotaxis protein CheX